MLETNSSGECGDQNASSISVGAVSGSAAMMAKCILLATLLGVVLLGNALTLHDACAAGHNSRKWSASLWLLKVLACLAILNAVVNIAAYLATIATARRDEGDLLCMLHGLVSAILVAAWTWTLALSSWERLTPDHRTLFSKLNTKVIAIGTFMLLVTVYMGPLYGWGEYTCYRGKLSLIVSASIIEPPPESSAAIPVMHLYRMWMENRPTETSPVALLHSRLSSPECGHANLLRPLLSPDGVTLPLRMPGRASLQCLWSCVEHVRRRWYLGDEISYDVNVDVDDAEYLAYTTVFLPYQESTMCGLDYSAVNQHTYSFLAFSLFCSFVVPFSLILYSVCLASSCCRRARRSISDRRASYGAMEDAYSRDLRRFVSYTGVVSLLCDLPYLATNLTASVGVHLPSASHFAASLLHYAQFAFPAVLFMLVKDGARACAYSAARSCIPTSTARRCENGATLLELRKTLLCAQPYAYARASVFMERTGEGRGAVGENGELIETAV